MTLDPRIRLHQDWLGMVQPTGLFLAPRVLADASASPTDPITEFQRALDARCEGDHLRDPIADLTELFRWPPEALSLRGASTDEALAPWPAEASLTLDGGVSVEADFALCDLDTREPVVLGMVVGDADLDAARDDPQWTASAHQRLERLLRAGRCPVGLLTNARDLRIVYAPRGEATAHATWHLRDLRTVAGRPMLAALHMCLHTPRLFTLDADQRLPALLARSREFQNAVSTRLQGQVLDALQELLDGLQRADRVARGALLAPWRDTDTHRQIIYRGLVTALLRMVVVLFAEERRLLPLDAPRYRESYALTDLHARLREDHARLGDRLDARYGAWARVVALFRLLAEGIDARAVPGGFSIPPRRGDLFDPDRFPFLEGRAPGPRAPSPLDLPKVSDGTVFRALDRLLVLDGERLKYSDLAVEQIGSVYEGLMGYTLEVAEGSALRVRVSSRESGSLDLVVDLARFESLSRKDFLRHLTDDLGLKPGDATLRAIERAPDAQSAAAALAARFKHTAAIDRGWMYLQPGEERRRSGSHYTPRALTAPIVERTLGPVLAALGPDPTPAQLLALRVCDPAMGSGAFLVEVCRQLAARLEAAWTSHRVTPAIPPDEDPHLHARRLVAQRCLYGVDRNPLAVELARLSLWLETFARDHAFTFLDHCLRHGDSLVGLSQTQIARLSWLPDAQGQGDLLADAVRRGVDRARWLRDQLHGRGDEDPASTDEQRELWLDSENSLYEARTAGDLVIAAFFAQKSDRDRLRWLSALVTPLQRWIAGDDRVDPVRHEIRRVLDEQGIVPFHWHLEFPEVFAQGGFDCIVGNPPYAGKNNLIAGNAEGYVDWLKALHEGSHGNADVVAHFFRRSFSMLREGGTFGLIATNTIAQGDTRTTGLQWLCTHGGTIYEARRRYKWPGVAAVVVTVVHMARGAWGATCLLDGREVERITAFLFHRGGHESPQYLPENAARAFQGTIVLGKGFTFDDREKSRDSVNSLADMRALIAKDPRNAERIFPYLGGEELNDDPAQKPHRYIINFGDMTEEEARRWPDLMAIVETKVKPERMKNNRDTYRKYWWQFAEKRGEMARAVEGKSRVLATSLTSSIRCFAFIPVGAVLVQQLVVFADDRDAFFAVLQSRAHTDWAAVFGATMKDDPRYTLSDCFETFPFPRGWEADAALAAIGRDYDAHRAAMMARTVGTKQPRGLTATYNLFHDRGCRDPEVDSLRALHARMDRAVLDAYGWTDVRPTYDFRAQLDERVRLTWDDDTRDEVLARLLEENRRRAAESAAAVSASAPAPKRARGGRKKGTPDDGTPTLL